MGQIRRVQELAPPDFATFVQLAATVGARRGTLVALRCGDVDPEAVDHFHPLDRRVGRGIGRKGDRGGASLYGCVGGGDGGGLLEHRARSLDQAAVVGTDLDHDSIVFSDDGGASHWHLSWPSHAWANYARRAAIPGVRLHDLRHTAASQMLMAGIPISVVAERLGCTEANILRTYRHFVPGSDQLAADLMDRLLAPAAVDSVEGS
jgi:integrase